VKPSISDAEAQVMGVLWDAARALSADAVAAQLPASTGWQMSTVKTLLGRLVAKQAASATPDGRRHLYAPLLKRQDWQAAQSGHLLDRLFDGRLAPLVAHFAATRKLSPEDRAALAQLLKEQDGA
jgi:BlaI family transcriptional regulator, penicillinase repressor